MSEDRLERMELRIAGFLRKGILVVACLLLVGWVWQLFEARVTFEAFRTYSHLSLVEKWKLEATGIPERIIDAGFFVLILLPFLRVVMTFVLFVKRKEYALAIAAGFVTVALILSFALGFEL